jgi:ligand-binding sensor protein
MPAKKSTPLTPSLFEKIRKEYRRLHGYELICVDAGGNTVFAGKKVCRCARHRSEKAFRRQAVLEAMRFGEPCVNLCPHGCQIWAVPLMRNEELLGGLVVAGVPLPGDREATKRAVRVHEACLGLLRLAETHNLTNRALL